MAALVACDQAIPAQTAPVVTPAVDARTVIAGIAEVSDGDTIKFGGMRVRIWGIDAPEGEQTCGVNDAGGASREAMVALADRQRVTCVMHDYDGYNHRPNAVCTTDAGVDLGARMVSDGWAWDYPEYSDGAYREKEEAAVASRAGLHAFVCAERPWEYRARMRVEARARGNQSER
jgi:endonuclease YncB( thermonuclease family)